MKLKRLLSVIFCFIMLATLLCACGSDNSISAKLEDYVKTLSYHDGFTILQLTDIHWNTGTQTGDGSYGSISYLNKLILEAENHIGRKIDLIEITGDTFMLTNTSAVDKFIDFMTDVDIPYAIIWGNHDGECEYNPNTLSEKFKNAPNSLYTEVEDDIHGRSNYIINLVDENGDAVWQIANLDSGSSYRKGAGDIKLTYDFLRGEQFDWLSAEHTLAGEDVPVICYYHIAQKEVVEYVDKILSGELECKHKFFKTEGYGASKYATNNEEYLLSCNVKGVFMGHCHGNDFTFTAPSGIVYGFGVKSGYELYYNNSELKQIDSGIDASDDMDIVGASLVTLNDTEGNFSIEHLYYNERSEGDLVLWVNYDGEN